MTLPAATCAACRLPIVKGKGFVVVGTEIIHKRTACLARAGETVLSKTIAAARKAQQQAVRATELAEQATASAKDAYAEADRLRARALAAEDALDTSRRVANQRLTAITADAVTIARLTRERDAARAEAALHQTIQGAADNVGIFQIVKPDEQKAEPEQKKQDEDASATRFSLLELT